VTLLEYLRKVGVDPEGDFLQEGAQLFAQLAIELEAQERIGAGRYPGGTPDTLCQEVIFPTRRAAMASPQGFFRDRYRVDVSG